MSLIGPCCVAPPGTYILLPTVAPWACTTPVGMGALLDQVPVAGSNRWLAALIVVLLSQPPITYSLSLATAEAASARAVVIGGSLFQGPAQDGAKSLRSPGPG